MQYQIESSKKAYSTGKQSSISKSRARNHNDSLLQGLQDAHLAGKRKLIRHLQNRYLNSYASRLVSAELAWSHIKPHLRPPKSSLPKIAEGLDPWRGTDERVAMILKDKESNSFDYRIILNFGIRNRALQYLVAQCLHTQTTLHPSQYAMNGGRPKAVARVHELMCLGYEYIVEMDIKNCYPSFDGEKLTGILSLPKEVTEHVVLSQHFNLYPVDPLNQQCESLEELLYLFSDDLTEARQGLPQGSAISSLVSEILLSSIFEQLPTCGIALSYADNILLMSKNKADMVSMHTALGNALEAHPAGPLKLNEPNEYLPGQSVKFLGYQLSMTKGNCCIEPTQYNLSKFEAKFKRRLQKISVETPPERRARTIKSLKRYVQGWSSAFALWPDALDYRKKHLALIEKLATL